MSNNMASYFAILVVSYMYLCLEELQLLKDRAVLFLPSQVWAWAPSALPLNGGRKIHLNFCVPWFIQNVLVVGGCVHVHVCVSPINGPHVLQKIA